MFVDLNEIQYTTISQSPHRLDEPLTMYVGEPLDLYYLDFYEPFLFVCRGEFGNTNAGSFWLRNWTVV